MSARRIAASLLVAFATSTALFSPAHAEPRPDPWVQGQIDAQTEDVPGFLDAVARSGVDRRDISDRDLVIKGHLICDQIYSGRGDISSAALPRTRPDDFRSMEIVAGASVKYLCPPAAEYVSPSLLESIP